LTSTPHPRRAWRNPGRSVRTDNTTEMAPEEHAEDLHRLIDALGVGAVDLFASSGGAVNDLTLVTRHPEQVRTFVGHEPQLLDVLPDRDQALAANEDIYATYQVSGMGPAMAKFMAMTRYIGPLPETYGDLPDPDPAEFGLPAADADDGSRDDPLLGQNIRRCAAYQPDLDALTRATTRIVIAAGKESEGQLTARASAILAQHLGTELAIFPRHHAGFLVVSSVCTEIRRDSPRHSIKRSRLVDPSGRPALADIRSAPCGVIDHGLPRTAAGWIHRRSSRR